MFQQVRDSQNVFLFVPDPVFTITRYPELLLLAMGSVITGMPASVVEIDIFVMTTSNVK